MKYTCFLIEICFILCFFGGVPTFMMKSLNFLVFEYTFQVFGHTFKFVGKPFKFVDKLCFFLVGGFIAHVEYIIQNPQFISTLLRASKFLVSKSFPVLVAKSFSRFSRVQYKLPQCDQFLVYMTYTSEINMKYPTHPSGPSFNIA